MCSTTCLNPYGPPGWPRLCAAPGPGVAVGEVERQAAFTVIKAAGASRLVPWYDLVSVQAEGNYTRVGLRDGTHCLVLRPLKQWLALAPAGAFVQVHRNALVRVDWIRALHADPHGVREIVLADGTSLPVGRAHWPELKVRLEQGGMPGSSPL